MAKTKTAQKQQEDLAASRYYTYKQYVLVEQHAGSCSPETIADLLGVSRRTFHRHLAADSELMARYKKGKGLIGSQVGGVLVGKALQGDVPSMLFYLKTRCNWVEGDKSKYATKIMNDMLEDRGDPPILTVDEMI